MKIGEAVEALERLGRKILRLRVPLHPAAPLRGRRWACLSEIPVYDPS
jgi:hypothetical protein